MKVKLNGIHLATCCALLTACGGGSSDSTTPTTAPNQTLPAGTAPTSINANTNQSVDLSLLYPNQTVSDISWQQTGGPIVPILSPNAKTIAFTAPESGTYTFTASYRLGGTETTKDFDVTVSSNQQAVNARLGHSVVEGNKISILAETLSTSDYNNLTWRQIAGPRVSIPAEDLTGMSGLFIDAPQVEEDSIITFEVSLNDSDTQKDQVSILIEDVPNILNNAYFEDPVAKTAAYVKSTQFERALNDCVYNNTISSSCTIGKLPVLGQSIASITPTVDEVMERVVVSHPWMAERFKTFLIEYDTHGDLKRLLRATTAVVISYDIRPSFYWAATGAIYLDANNFWITADERDTINSAPDFRASFGDDLQFSMPWRYVKNNDYIDKYQSRSDRSDRELKDNALDVVSLMYHELAHANDFYPYNEWNQHSSNTRLLDAILDSNFESDKLAITYPLTSDEMYSLGQVRFQGVTATSTQSAYSPSDVQGFFTSDNASDFYNYSSEREDLAMLFDEFMMQSRYQIYRDVAITNNPSGSNVTATDYIVTWGQRGRVGEALIKPRAAYVVRRLLPEFDVDSALENLITPIPMVSGDNWIDNLTIGPESSKPASARKFINEEERRPNTGRVHYHKPLPKQ